MSTPPPAFRVSDIPDSHPGSCGTAMSETFIHLWAALGWREDTPEYPKLSHAFLQMEKLRAGWTNSEIAASLVRSGLDMSNLLFKDLLRDMDEEDIGPIKDAFNFVEGVPKLKLWTDEVAQWEPSDSVYMALLEYFTEVQREGEPPVWEEFNSRKEYRRFQ
ncbi:hypothetical protein N7444_013594 [Penicillium canescens]|nr:hypothetical protein N7444_013594 [Penicillium canescens]